MKIVCLDASTLGCDVDLSASFAKFGDFVSYDITAPSQTIERLKDADVVITNKVLITKEVMDATNLKLICVSATGTNNIDLDYAAAKGIPVKNVAGYSTPSVTQQCFALLFSLLNHTAFYDDYCKCENGWASSPIFVNLDRPVSELESKKFGIVGLGTIGKKVASVASAFGAQVCYYSTSGKNSDAVVKKVSFDELLECDIISIHAPLNPQTKGLFDASALKRLKNGTILMNFGRGGIVDEAAVAAQVDERELYFITDVLEVEPMVKNHPFLSVKNKDRLVLSPHIAWASKEARVRLVALMVKNVEDFLTGK